jgi:hypothetical protein
MKDVAYFIIEPGQFSPFFVFITLACNIFYIFFQNMLHFLKIYGDFKNGRKNLSKRKKVYTVDFFTDTWGLELKTPLKSK